MNILAIDPSTTEMGWAVGDTKDRELQSSGVLSCPGDWQRARRLNHMTYRLNEVMEAHEPGFVIYYRPFSRGEDATRCGWGIAGIIEAEAAFCTAAVDDIQEGTVRSWHGIVAPKGLTQNARRKWLKQAAIDMASTKWDIKFTDDNEADAALLLYYALHNAKVTPCPKP